MQMILESRVDRLENLMAEVIELHREFTHEMSDMKVEAAERDRKFEEHIRQEKETQSYSSDSYDVPSPVIGQPRYKNATL
ncbi:MAG: hypothetical protein HQL03_13585 [Nitrospirae bacterium]|nr:hypothetical protein [Nitrospirota bacterium]